ncbi:MAG TPA: hypothetical protein VGS13_12135 [Stellaceae bacterium]|nr:hypothetical protein [Stellaceae bacterium]
MMRGFTVTALVATVPALAACGGVPAAVLGGLGAAGSLYSAIDKITQATNPYVAKACAEYETGKAAADATLAAGVVASPVAGKVTSIESFGDSACATPPSDDPLSTAIWLGQLAGQLTTLTAPPV